MDYNETLAYLYDSTPVFHHVGSSAYREGLETSQILDQHLGYPHHSYHTIHVGGTNGKGSTSHLLASILQQSGYRVGLYTSPHLLDFRERIRVDGQMIPEDYVVDFVERHRSFFEPLHPSFFELTMSLAFDYFAKSEVDVAIIEVGLGGRLDSTNIINPVLSVITNISKDHMNILGDTLEKIAGEKAGIIKSGIPVVIGEATGSVRKVFEDKALEVATRIVFAEDEPRVYEMQPLPGGRCRLQTKGYPDLECALGGSVQKKNAATVLCALEELQSIFRIPAEAVYRGFEQVTALTGLQGRWQVISSSPKIILDTGHNEAGIAQVAEQLKQENFHRLHIVFGMLRDKDVDTILRILPQEASYYFTRVQVPRSLSETELSEKARILGLHGAIYSSVPEAVAAARHMASPDDLIFIGGSNLVVAEALPML